MIHPDVPPRIYLCRSRRCRVRGSVLVFLGQGEGSLFEPSPERPTSWCYTCGTKNGARVEYVLAPGAAPPPSP
jgi:hypothetical protein